MIYLSRFYFPDGDREFDFRRQEKRQCFDTFYPFHVLSAKGLTALEMDHVTLLYGGNGSGKTTAINVMGEKLGLKRDALYNRSSFFEDYTALCDYDLRAPLPPDSRIITSDDVFDFMLDLRSINQGIDQRREDMFEEYMDAKYSEFRLRSMEDYEQLKKVNDSRRMTQSRFVKKNLKANVREQSNGESAYYYFTSKIRENGLYLLDEPENSLAPAKQRELVGFMEDSVRFFGCQFVIATHSPFILAMREAKIYDLDADPPAVRRWTELPAVREYYEFFKGHSREFGDE